MFVTLKAARFCPVMFPSPCFVHSLPIIFGVFEE